MVKGLNGDKPLSEVNGNSSRDSDSGQAFELDVLEAALIVAVGKPKAPV